MTLLDSLRLGLALRRLTRSHKVYFSTSWCSESPEGGFICWTQPWWDPSDSCRAKPHYGRTALEAVRKAEKG